MAKSKKQKHSAGITFWTDPTNGDHYAVFNYKITVDGQPKRKQARRRIPDGAPVSEQWKIAEDLVRDTNDKLARAESEAPGVNSTEQTKAVNPHTLTWERLAAEYQDHCLQPPVFDPDSRLLIKGSPSWKNRRYMLRPIVELLGPKKLLRDCRTIHLSKFYEARLAQPVTKKVQRKDRKTGAWIILKEIPIRARKPAAVHRDLGLISCLLSYAMAHEWISKNPWSDKLIDTSKEKGREEIYNTVEQAALLGQFDQAKKQAHAERFFTVMFDTGCRPAELRRLLVKDVNFATNEILIYSLKGKKRRERRFPLTTRAAAAIEESIIDKGPSDHVFTYDVKNRKTGELERRPLKFALKTSFATAKRLAKETDQVDLSRFRAYDIRHTTITRLANSPDLTVPQLMQLSGHTQLTTFMRYVNPDHATRQRAASVLENYQDPAPAKVVDIKRQRPAAKAKRKTAAA
jgi:integrase